MKAITVEPKKPKTASYEIYRNLMSTKAQCAYKPSRCLRTPPELATQDTGRITGDPEIARTPLRGGPMDKSPTNC